MIKTKFIFLLILLLSSFVFASEESKSCPVISKCLNQTPKYCNEENSKPNKKIKYDQEFCTPIQEVFKRGLSPESPIGKTIYAEFGSEYRVIYESKGEFSASKGMISFLFDHMPFTAELINAYQESNYELHYNTPDQKSFSGTNGRSLSGDFHWALQDSANTKKGFRNVFLGYGRAKVLRWTLYETAIAFLDMNPLPNNKISYKLRAIVFPGSSILNSIMQMNVFKHVVSEKLNHIVKDVVNSANSFAKGNEEPIQKRFVNQNSKNKQTLQLFKEVVDGRPWTLGDALKKEPEHGK